MQRCLQAWMPLPRGRLQAAAMRSLALRLHDRPALPKAQLIHLSTIHNSTIHDDRSEAPLASHDPAQPSDGDSKTPRTFGSDSADEVPYAPAQVTTKVPRNAFRRRPVHETPFMRHNKTYPEMFHLVLNQYRKELGMPHGSSQRNQLHPDAAKIVDEFMSPTIWRTRWLTAVIWLLENDKEKVPAFLVRTHRQNPAPTTWVAETIKLLAMYFANQEEEIARPVVASIAEALNTLTKRKEHDPLELKSGQIRDLLPHLAHGEVQEIFGHIKKGTLRVDWPAFCHLCRYFADQGDIEEAVNAFIGFLTDGKYPEKLMVDTLLYIIKRLVSREDGYRQSLRLVENLQQFGVSMKTVVANELLWNAFSRQEYQIAFDLYRMLFGEHQQPDASTFAILLKLLNADHKTDLSLEHIVEEAFRTEVVFKNKIIASQVLHTYSVHALEEPSTAWSRLCHLFSRLFKGNSLALLDMPDASDTANSDSDKRLPPTGAAVNGMIQAYLTLHGQGFLQESDPVDVYKKFNSLVVNGQQPFLEMASSDYTYNFFLYSFIQERETLINATEVMKDMQTPLPQSTGVTKAKPSVRSWSIFLMGFQRHNKQQLADSILQHMENEGILPNEVTWNILVNSYAQHQQLDELVNVLQQADDAGMEYSEYTERGLKRFRNQRKLHDALKTKRQRRELDFSHELKALMEKKLQTGSHGTQS